MGADMRRGQVVAVAVVAIGVIAPGTAAAAVATVPASVAHGAAHTGNGPSSGAVVSADGRFVAFSSRASNLVAGDTNGLRDAFVRDLVTSKTRVMSDPPGQAQANGPSHVVDISEDGRFVLFLSDATNLSPPRVGGMNDVNGSQDAFVRDRSTGRTAFASLGRGGVQPTSDVRDASLSANGRFVAFTARFQRGCGGYGVWVRDLVRGTTTLVSRRNNGTPFCRARHHGGIVTHGLVSNDGQIVAFDLSAGVSDGSVTSLAVVRDRAAHRVTVVGSFENHVQDLTSNGRFVAYTTHELGGSTGIELRDRQLHTTTEVVRLVLLHRRASGGAHVSDDGRLVGFWSEVGNLAGGDTNRVADVFVSDLQAHTTVRVSVADDGSELHRPSRGGGLTEDGQAAVFWTEAARTAGADANGADDVFLRRLS